MAGDETRLIRKQKTHASAMRRRHQGNSREDGYRLNTAPVESRVWVVLHTISATWRSRRQRGKLRIHPDAMFCVIERHGFCQRI